MDTSGLAFENTIKIELFNSLIYMPMTLHNTVPESLFAFQTSLKH